MNNYTLLVPFILGLVIGALIMFWFDAKILIKLFNDVMKIRQNEIDILKRKNNDRTQS